MEPNPASPKSEGGVPEIRRGFIAKVTTVVLGGFALLGPALAALAAYLNPVRQKSAGGEFFRLANIVTLPEDGTPRRFPVITDRVDAWNRYPKEAIGAVWLRRTEDAERPVVAFQVICPHAGCTIAFDSAADGPRFFCPCHAAGFTLDGQRMEQPSPSPRDLDTLEVDIRDGGEVWVKFENFVTGTSKKVAES